MEVKIKEALMMNVSRKLVAKYILGRGSDLFEWFPVLWIPSGVYLSHGLCTTCALLMNSLTEWF